MRSMADKFPFMRVYMEAAEELDKEDRADFYDALIHYALDDEEPERSVGAAVFRSVKRMVDKWKQTSAAGRKRAETAGRSVDGRWNTAGKSLVAKTQQKNKSIKDKKNKDIKDKNAQDAIDLYNSICISLPQVKVLNSKRISAVNARLKKYTPEEIRSVFERAERSDFLSGRKTKWRASFDWLIDENNIAKVLEGNYDDQNAIIKRTAADIQRIDIPQEEYTELEEMFR